MGREHAGAGSISEETPTEVPAPAEWQYQGRHKLRMKPRSRAIIFKGNITDFTAATQEVVKAMRGKIKEPRMSRNGELIVEVEDDGDALHLQGLKSLAGVRVEARES